MTETLVEEMLYYSDSNITIDEENNRIALFDFGWFWDGSMEDLLGTIFRIWSSSSKRYLLDDAEINFDSVFRIIKKDFRNQMLNALYIITGDNSQWYSSSDFMEYIQDNVESMKEDDGTEDYDKDLFSECVSDVLYEVFDIFEEYAKYFSENCFDEILNKFEKDKESISNWENFLEYLVDLQETCIESLSTYLSGLELEVLDKSLQLYKKGKK